MYGRNQKPVNDPRAEHQRKKTVFFDRLAGKLNGAEERKAAAQAKRDRKAAKRASDAFGPPATEPCGECHLRPNEVCDICGRKAAP